jgi:hypothetical protein
MLRRRFVPFAIIMSLTGVVGGPRSATACFDPLPASVGASLELLPLPANGFRLTLYGGTAFGSPAGEGCGCAVAAPATLVGKFSCSATALRIIDATNAFGTFGTNTNTQADFEALMQSQVENFSGGYVVTGFATTLASAISLGASLTLEADFECSVPFTPTILAAVQSFLSHSAVLGTGPVNPDGTINFSDPSHIGVSTVSVNPKCTGGKTKCVAKKTDGLMKCHAKAESSGLPVDSLCIQKAHDKFDGGLIPSKGCFEKLEAKGGCLTTDDTPVVEAAVDAFVDDIVTDLDPGYPTPVQNACEAAKKKCVGKTAKKILGCYSKAQKKNAAVDPACVTSATTAFTTCFTSAEAIGGCAVTGDLPAIQAKLDTFVADTSCALDPGTCP